MSLTQLHPQLLHDKTTMGEYILDSDEIQASSATFGKPFLKEFLIDPSYRNLNHGETTCNTPSLTRTCIGKIIN